MVRLRCYTIINQLARSFFSSNFLVPFVGLCMGAISAGYVALISNVTQSLTHFLYKIAIPTSAALFGHTVLLPNAYKKRVLFLTTYLLGGVFILVCLFATVFIFRQRMVLGAIGNTSPFIMAGLLLAMHTMEYLVLMYEKFLIAHNVKFDKGVVCAEFIRSNIGNNINKINKICTKESSSNFCKIPNPYRYNEYKWPSLSELHMKLFNITYKEAHNALVDTKTCAKCFFELVKKGVIKLNL
jgi:hypothetical protein